MVEWSKDQVAAIGPLNLNFEIFGRIGLNWRPGRSKALRWKVETIGWEGWRVVCGKAAPRKLGITQPGWGLCQEPFFSGAVGSV
jgi:hypothetical protein